MEQRLDHLEKGGTATRWSDSRSVW